MPRTFFRLPATFLFHYFGRVTSAVPITRRCSSIACPPKIQSVELDRAAAPIDGCDYHHWLVVMDPPIGYPLRHQIVERYIQTLASALGSEEEAKRSMYSVSTKYYYAFGCKINENLCPMSDGFCRILIFVLVTMIMEEKHLLMGVLFPIMKCSIRTGYKIQVTMDLRGEPEEGDLERKNRKQTATDLCLQITLLIQYSNLVGFAEVFDHYVLQSGRCKLEKRRLLSVTDGDLFF